MNNRVIKNASFRVSIAVFIRSCENGRQTNISCRNFPAFYDAENLPPTWNEHLRCQRINYIADAVARPSHTVSANIVVLFIKEIKSFPC